MTDEEPAVTEETLSPTQLHARAWAIVASAAEDRGEDIDELLVTLPWQDLVTVVFAISHTLVDVIARLHGHDSDSDEGRADVAEQARRLVLRVTTDDDS